MRALLGILGFSLSVFEPVQAQVSTGEQAAVVLPQIDLRIELSGRGLIEALRRGGNVLYMRHAETGEVTQDCKLSNLTKNGEAQARTVGVGIRTLRIPVGEVWASEYCRSLDTGRLLDVGVVRITESLNLAGSRPGFDLAAERYKRLSSVPAPGTNTVLVSHLFTMGSQDRWIVPELAEVVVFQPDGKGGTTPVARIPVGKWGELAKLIAID